MSYPKWSELPDIDLYLDQVLLYINQIEGENQHYKRELTASMINNYVKHGQLAKPIKKKYNRQQIARLIVITSFKNVFSIQEISQTLALLTKNEPSQLRYDEFVACMNGEMVDNLPPIIISACQTLQLYHQTHQLVKDLKGENDGN